jgi:zinc/manganese transport system substrate-binding protein
MKNIFLLSIFMAVIFIGSLFAKDKVKIVTTLTDLASLAEVVGGDKVEVQALAKGTQDPHQIEVLPSYMMKLRKADLFILVGMDLDMWAYQLRDGSRNSNLIVIDCSQEINRLEIPTQSVNPSQGHIHIHGNPHYWLDPENGKAIMQAILYGLEKVAPEHSEFFHQNMNNYIKQLDSKMVEWQKKVEPIKGEKIIFYHNSWPYFVERFGFKIANFVEPKPGIPPSPSHTANLLKQVKSESIKVIALEPYFDDRVPKMIAKQTGAKVVILPQSVGGVKEVKDYIQLFDYNLNKLIEAFGN